MDAYSRIEIAVNITICILKPSEIVKYISCNHIYF